MNKYKQVSISMKASCMHPGPLHPTVFLLASKAQAVTWARGGGEHEKTHPSREAIAPSKRDAFFYCGSSLPGTLGGETSEALKTPAFVPAGAWGIPWCVHGYGRGYQ